jgi:hypothetical protein
MEWHSSIQAFPSQLFRWERRRATSSKMPHQILKFLACLIIRLAGSLQTVLTWPTAVSSSWAFLTKNLATREAWAQQKNGVEVTFPPKRLRRSSGPTILHRTPWTKVQTSYFLEVRNSGELADIYRLSLRKKGSLRIEDCKTIPFSEDP